MYEDDGESFGYRKGDWMGLAMQWNNAARRLTLTLAPGSRMRPPARRDLELRVGGGTRVVRATFTGSPLSITL
jgi:hypothetical protein